MSTDTPDPALQLAREIEDCLKQGWFSGDLAAVAALIRPALEGRYQAGVAEGIERSAQDVGQMANAHLVNFAEVVNGGELQGTLVVRLDKAETIPTLLADSIRALAPRKTLSDVIADGGFSSIAREQVAHDRGYEAGFNEGRDAAATAIHGEQERWHTVSPDHPEKQMFRDFVSAAKSLELTVRQIAPRQPKGQGRRKSLILDLIS